jgi:hypothetical protein
MMRFYISMVLVLLSIFLAVPRGYANEKQDQSVSVYSADLPKLNREVELARKNFDENSVLFSSQVFQQPSLAYDIRLSKGFRKVDLGQGTGQDKISFGRGLFIKVDDYIGPSYGDLNARFQVSAVKLPFLMNAKNWLLNHILENYYSLIGIDVSSDKRVQAQYVAIRDNVPYVIRAVAQISGNKLLLAEYVVPQDMWGEVRDQAIWSMVTFRLTEPSSEPAEKMKEHLFLDIAQFQYPVSWDFVAAPVRNSEILSARLSNVRGGGSKMTAEQKMRDFLLSGRIDIVTPARTNVTKLSDEIQKINSELAAENFKVGDKLNDKHSLKLHPSILKQTIESYQLEGVQTPLAGYEYWIAILTTENRYYFVSLITVSRQHSYLEWSRNISTFEYILKSLSPVAKSS